MNEARAKKPSLKRWLFYFNIPQNPRKLRVKFEQGIVSVNIRQKKSNMISDAVGLDRLSRVLGYVVKRGDFATVSPNLPKVIVVLGEANHANQSGLDTDPIQINSAKQAGDLFGYGSPIHIVMRILRPVSSDGVGGIKTIVIPQAEVGGAQAKTVTISPSGVANNGGTHFVKIAGRDSIDGVTYSINVQQGDTAADLTDKIADAVNKVLSSPMSAAETTEYEVTLTSKWRGLTAQDLKVSIDTGDDDLGLTYVVAQTQAGSGTPDIAAALAAFGNNWYTDVVNTYGAVSTIMDALEQFNGNPVPSNPTGRYGGIIFKPFIAYTGSVLDDPSSLTDSRSGELTIAFAPAPLSEGLPMEAAANMCLLFSVISQNTPHLDVNGQSYPDMPTPTDIGSMADYNNRDAIVKKGCSTVDLVASKYQVQDFVTTYHPDGENPAQFRYCRNLNLDWNVRYGYYLKEVQDVLDHVIAGDNDTVSASNVIKPKQWKGIIGSYALDLVSRGLVTDAAFMQDSITVGIGTSNPDRFETFFRYKRTGVARISATSAEAGFNFGTN